MKDTMKKTRVEQLAELMASVPEEQQELVAAQLLGVAQGVMLAAAIDEGRTSAWPSERGG